MTTSVEVKSYSSGYVSQDEGKENALARVANLPVVASTWNAMCSYYTNVKKNHPNVSPYLEVAENMTSSAANIAMATSRPVVDKFAPTVNSYANMGLDKLEDKVPIITKEPEEIYKETKSKATDILSNKMNNALSITEKYVDYYLPSDESENEKSEEDDDDESGSSEDSESVEETEKVKNPKERIQDISNKVRRRSYKRAMRKWQGVQARSKEALSKLSFTVDLIQYAKGNIGSSSSSSVKSSVSSGITSAAGSIKEVEEHVLVRARKLTNQLNESCARAINYLQNSPQLGHLLEQAKNAKVATEEVYTAFTEKTSLSQISSSAISTTRSRIEFIEKTLISVLSRISDQPPIAWLTPDLDIDPLGGMDMEEIEAQLYERPQHENGVVWCH